MPMKNKCMTLPLFDAVLANKYNAVSRLALLCSQAFRWRWLVAQNLRRCARLFKIMKWIRFPTLFAIAFSTDASELIFRLWTKVNGFQRLVCIVSVMCWKDKVLFIYITIRIGIVSFERFAKHVENYSPSIKSHWLRRIRILAYSHTCGMNKPFFNSPLILSTTKSDSAQTLPFVHCATTIMI